MLDEPMAEEGRPAHSRIAQAQAIRLVRSKLAELSPAVGESTLSTLLPDVPLRLIRLGLRTCKAHRRRRE